MLGVSLEVALIILILVLQPLIGLIWAYLIYRAVISYTARVSGNWVDKRVDQGVEKAKEVLP